MLNPSNIEIYQKARPQLWLYFDESQKLTMGLVKRTVIANDGGKKKEILLTGNHISIKDKIFYGINMATIGAFSIAGMSIGIGISSLLGSPLATQMINILSHL